MKRLFACFIAASVLATTAIAQTFDTPQGYFEDASRLHSLGDTEAAVIQLRNALQLYADHVPSLLLLGRIELEQRAAGEAIQLLEDALLQGADPTIVLPPLANAYLQRGEYSRLLTRVPVENTPTQVRPTILAAHVEANIALNRLDRAETRLEQGLALDPDLPDLRLAEVSLRLRQGNIDQAEALATSLIQKRPSDSRSWNARASVHHVRGEVADAIAGYERTIAIEPLSADARIALISLLIDTQRFDAAATQVAWMREQIPSDPRAAYFSALLAARDGDREKEATELETAAAIFDAVGSEKMTADPQIQMMSGLTYYSRGAFEKARGSVGQYLALDGEDVGAARLMASILVAMNEAQEAVQLLQPFHRRDPQDITTTMALADALNAANKPLEAARLLETIPGVGSGSHAGDQRLAKALLDSGDTTRGTQLLELSLASKADGQTSLLLVLAYLRNADFAAARNHLKEIAQANGWTPLLWNLDAIAQAGAGEQEAAIATLERLTRDHEAFYPAWVNLARLQRDSGNWLAARSSLHRARRLAPDDPRLDYEMAQQFLTENDPEEALRYAERAAIGSPGTLAYAILETDLQLALGHPDDALDAALRAASYDGASAAARRLLASTQARTGDREQALITLKRAARAADFNAVELTSIAGLQLSLGDYQGAASTIDDALKGDARYLPARRTLVQVQVGLGTPDSAMELVEALIDEQPNDPTLRLLKGEAAMAAAQYAVALNAFREAELMGADDIAVIGQVDALQALKQHSAARQRLSDYVQAGGKHPELRGRFGDELIRAKDWNAALTVLEGLAADYPETPTVINNLAVVQHEAGDERAVATARKALELAPAQAYTNDTLGWLLLQTGKPTEALGFLREATTRAAQDPEMRYHLAVALARLDREPEALVELKRALDSDTTFADRSAAQAMLKELESIR